MINHQNLGNVYNEIPQDPGRDGFDSGLPADKFGMVLDYNRIGHIGLAQNVQAQWNGNISWLMYRMKDVSFSGTDMVGYSFTYDGINRLKQADFGYYTQNWMGTNSFDEKNINYDQNGNILKLYRYGSSGNYDDFTYNYQQNTNRVNDILFYQTEPYNSYSYDGNGNVTKDELRGISFIIYDADNLPLSIYKTNGEQLRYFYDVNGNRIRKSFVGGTENFYINDAKGNTEVLMHDASGRNYSYNIRGNDVVGQIRITNNYQSGRIYFLKDHLGSIRMTLDASGNIIGYDDYYPFGSIMPERSMVSTLSGKYRFTGKERDTESGYDYFGARYYDSKFARWLSVDPLADKYPGWSPYVYTLNNPLRYVDPDGMEVDWYLDENGVPTYDNNVQNQNDLKDGQIYLGDQGFAFNEQTGEIVQMNADGSYISGAYSLGSVEVTSGIGVDPGTYALGMGLLFNRADQITGEAYNLLKSFVNNSDDLAKITKIGAAKTITEFLGITGLLVSSAIDVNSYDNNTLSGKQLGINLGIGTAAYLSPGIGLGLFIYDKTIGIDKTINSHLETINLHRELGIPIPAPGTGF